MKSMKAVVMILSLSLAFLAASISSFGQEVHYNYDRSANFAEYRTYQWVEFPADAISDQLIEQAIKRAVDEQLAQKGFTKVETGGQLKVGYHAGVHIEKSISVTRMGDGPGRWNSGIDQGQTSTIPVGILLVDLIDTKRNQLVWRGDATKTLDLKKDPNKNYRNLQKAMQKLFKNYPPPQSK
jgi:hypothetical protein